MSKKTPILARIAMVLVLICARSLDSTANPPGARGPSPRRPKLIVVVVIDQFRYDYLERFRSWFVEGGFNLLLEGANFVNCRYDDATTLTCPGHASLFTGAYPNVHGIIGNEWFDASRSRRINCVEDPDTSLVGGKAGTGYSPRNLIGSTIGDELRLASGLQSKVISISLKDRGAIVPGGHTANAAYWYDGKMGRFVSSTYYMRELPPWVIRFNDEEPVKTYCGKPWQALPETPRAGGKLLKQLDLGQPCPSANFLAWLHETPFMNAIEFDLAREAIRNEGLGQGPSTDLLCISLSANDLIGHAFGPYSDEVADTTLRTDRYLASFFQELDRSVGLANVWIVLSADHGVAPNPRTIHEQHLGPGNVPLALKSSVEQALAQSLGQDQWVQDFSGFYITLNSAALKKRVVDRTRAENLAAEAAQSVPGVLAAFTRTQFLTGSLPATPIARKAANSYNSQRGGDVFIVLDPFAVAVSGETGSTHGTVWSYDAQVPLILWGEAFRPGVYATPVEPIDLAPTLAVALGLTPPSGSQGKPLTTALKHVN